MYQLRDLSRKLSSNPRAASKICAVDPGIVAAFSPAASNDLGQRLETAVLNAIRRRARHHRAGSISRLLAKNGHAGAGPTLP